jgi:hypothetical protein
VARHELTALNGPSPVGLQDRSAIHGFAQAVQDGDLDNADAVKDQVPTRALSDGNRGV